MPPRDRNATPLAVPAMTVSTLDAGRDRRWHLRAALIGCRWAERWVLPLGRDVLLGRDPERDADQDLATIADPNVSRTHARIQRQGDRVEIIDAGSTNGTWVNGHRVTRRRLDPGDVVRIGDSVFVVAYDVLDADDADTLGILGRSGDIAQLRRTIRRVARSPLPILVIGPTGTGKELIARALHQESVRDGELVAINCAALPATLVESALFGHKKGSFTGATADAAGAFRQADGGTLFLDEVGEMPIDIQPKLLRALEPGDITPVGGTTPVRVQTRVVAATNRPLLEAAAAGQFREDLYARLAGVVLRTPPLNERRGDIMYLFRRFLPEALADRPVDADMCEAMLVYDWPRNVRELKTLADRVGVLYGSSARLELGMLDEIMQRRLERQRQRSGSSVDTPAVAGWPPTREQLVELLKRCDGNVSAVGKLVNRNRKQVYRWMDQHEIDRGTGRDD